MDTNVDLLENRKVLLKQEVFQVIGCALDVLNEVGHGLHESIYENGLVVEFGLKNILFEQQKSFPVLYKGHPIGSFRPDLIAFGTLIIDAKVIDRITDHERGQMLNCLRITKLRVGVIVNFKNARLEWERIVL